MKKVELKPAKKATPPKPIPTVEEDDNEPTVTVTDQPMFSRPRTSSDIKVVKPQMASTVQDMFASMMQTPKLSSSLQPPQPRVIVPETSKKSSHDKEDDEDDDDEEKNDHDGEDDEDDGDEGEEDGEEDMDDPAVGQPSSTLETKSRKPRTKKTYPPGDFMYEALIKALCDLREQTRKVITMARETQKCTNRETRDLKNVVKKQKGEKPKRKPRGFALPSCISNEMIDYLLNVAKITKVDRKVGKQVVGQVTIEPGCLLARNELTSALCTHFRDSGMRKDPQDHRKIYLDKVTEKLFGIDSKKFKEEDGGTLSSTGEPIITYFDLQRYLPRHCSKQAAGH